MVRHLKNQNFSNFCRALSEAEDVKATADRFASDLALEILLNQSNFQNDRRSLTFVIRKRIILDLINQGWQLRFTDSKPGLSYPLFSQNSKDLVRKRHSFERNALMEKESVRKFVQKMEHSGIFSVIRNGEKLLEALSKDRYKAIKPYLQFAKKNERCSYTGLRLMDIWRYFRYTWVNAYRSAPGRSVRILVRDAAAPNHAIIGIASLGNTVIQQTVRDDWIGWNVGALVGNFDHPSDLISWCSNTIDNRINDIYLHDLLEQGLYTKSDAKILLLKPLLGLSKNPGKQWIDIGEHLRKLST